MKTMCSPGYPHNGFVATDAHGHMVYSCHKAIVVFHIYIYIYTHTLHIIYLSKFTKKCYGTICNISKKEKKAFNVSVCVYIYDIYTYI